MSKNHSISIEQQVKDKILHLRNLGVLLDSDIADIYGIELKQMKREVNKNINRFPGDFMFEMTKEEFDYLKSHSDIFKNRAKSKNLPRVYTLSGIVMLSGILNCEIAIKTNIQIIKSFSQMRKAFSNIDELPQKVYEIEKKGEERDENLRLIVEFLKKFEDSKSKNTPIKNKTKIGF